MTDRELEQLAQRLGTEAADRLDVRATARKIVERLHREAAQTPWFQATWLRIAAAVAVVIGGAIGVSRLVTPARPVHAAHLVADDLRGLSTAQLEDVLMSFDVIVSESAVTPEVGNDLHELDAQQLQAVLRSLEG